MFYVQFVVQCFILKQSCYSDVSKYLINYLWKAFDVSKYVILLSLLKISSS